MVFRLTKYAACNEMIQALSHSDRSGRRSRAVFPLPAGDFRPPMILAGPSGHHGPQMIAPSEVVRKRSHGINSHSLRRSFRLLFELYFGRASADFSVVMALAAALREGATGSFPGEQMFLTGVGNRVYCSPIRLPTLSSSGLGHRPFTAVTRVRLPLGSLKLILDAFGY